METKELLSQFFISVFGYHLNLMVYNPALLKDFMESKIWVTVSSEKNHKKCAAPFDKLEKTMACELKLIASINIGLPHVLFALCLHG